MSNISNATGPKAPQPVRPAATAKAAAQPAAANKPAVLTANAPALAPATLTPAVLASLKATAPKFKNAAEFQARIAQFAGYMQAARTDLAAARQAEDAARTAHAHAHETMQAPIDAAQKIYDDTNAHFGGLVNETSQALYAAQDALDHAIHPGKTQGDALDSQVNDLDSQIDGENRQIASDRDGISQADQNIGAAQDERQRAESDLRQADSDMDRMRYNVPSQYDLSNAQSRMNDAESELSRARSRTAQARIDLTEAEEYTRPVPPDVSSGPTPPSPSSRPTPPGTSGPTPPSPSGRPVPPSVNSEPQHDPARIAAAQAALNIAVNAENNASNNFENARSNYSTVANRLNAYQDAERRSRAAHAAIDHDAEVTNESNQQKESLGQDINHLQNEIPGQTNRRNALAEQAAQQHARKNPDSDPGVVAAKARVAAQSTELPKRQATYDKEIAEPKARLAEAHAAYDAGIVSFDKAVSDAGAAVATANQAVDTVLAAYNGLPKGVGGFQKTGWSLFQHFNLDKFWKGAGAKQGTDFDAQRQSLMAGH